MKHLVGPSWTILGKEFQDIRNRLNDTNEEIKYLRGKVNNNFGPKMLFEALRYHNESAKERDVPHVITFEETSYNVGHAMNVVTGMYRVV